VSASLELAAARPGQVLLVCYESLVADPTREMLRLANELEIPFEAALTRPSFAGKPIHAMPSQVPAGPATDNTPLAHPPGLDPDELARIEQEAMPLYRRAQHAVAAARGASDN
jgi:hypothetical protein